MYKFKRRSKKVTFYNRCCGAKKQLQDLVYQIFTKYGCAKTSQIVDRLKGPGFYYSTSFGLSIGLLDLVLNPLNERSFGVFSSLRNVKKDQIYLRSQLTSGFLYESG